MAQVADALKLRLYRPMEAWRARLREFVCARLQLIEMISAAQNQLQYVTDSGLSRQLKANLQQMQRNCSRLEQQIAEQVREQPQLEAMKVLKGVGPVLQSVLAAHLPELGVLNRKAIAKLVGMAPIARDSGSMRGLRRICYGRIEVRNVLYRACLSAIRHEPVIGKFYQSLKKRGKPSKVAIVAAMHKMLPTFVRHQRNRGVRVMRPASTESPRTHHATRFGGSMLCAPCATAIRKLWHRCRKTTRRAPSLPLCQIWRLQAIDAIVTFRS